jgi:hypothetical protein
MSFYSILVNNRLYTPPNEGINWPLWHRSVKNLPSGWFNYSNNGIKHYCIKENHTLCTIAIKKFWTLMSSCCRTIAGKKKLDINVIVLTFYVK